MSDKTFEITYTKTFDLEILSDTINTAVEGGINYWADIISYKHTEGIEHTTATIRIKDELRDDEHDKDHYVVDVEVIKTGLVRLLTGEVSVSSWIMSYLHQSLDDNSAYMIDADAADCIVQAGLLGEVRFG